MNRWEELATTAIPDDGGELRLLRRGDEYSIRIRGGTGDLMNSRTHGSEDALGVLACEPWADKHRARILIGGLGMGFTLAAALATLRHDAEVVVAEYVPGVVDWHREFLGPVAGYPTDDRRVRVETADVGELISGSGAWDSIILDVDNGPEGLTHPHNDRLYALAGLSGARAALRDSGVLAVWSAAPAPTFTSRLRDAGFEVAERRVHAHGRKGPRHVIWLATRTH